MSSKTLLRRCSAIVPAITACSQLAYAQPATSCLIGGYKLANDKVVDIEHADGGDLSWIMFDGESGGLHRQASGQWDGTYGWTDRKDGKTVNFEPCAKGKINFDGVGGRRIPFDVRNISFESHGTRLAGRLVMPPGTGKVPVVVLIHGSEDDSAIDSYYLQRLLPGEGIGVFVYDKRGTGRSGGHYTQVFSVLADDAVRAVAEARSLAGNRLGRVGLQGSSEGGWVAPLTAERTPVDFVIVCYGLAVDIIEEDQESAALQMQDAGASAEDTAKALAVAGAAENLAASGFKYGYRTFDALRAKYKREPWYKHLRGDFTWMLLPDSDAQLRALAPKLNAWHIPFYYQPMPVLIDDQVPQLWILGGQDFEAPCQETSRRIKSLISMGKPFTLACYPNADHQIRLFETKPDGTRVYTRYAPDYFAMMRDYIISGRLPAAAYGDAAITRPIASSGSDRSLPTAR